MSCECGHLQLFPWKTIATRGAIAADEHLGFQLDAFARFLADQAFDADSHVFLEMTVIGAGKIGAERDAGVLIRQADAVQSGRVAPGAIFFRDRPRCLVEFRERQSRFQYRHVMVDLLAGSCNVLPAATSALANSSFALTLKAIKPSNNTAILTTANLYMAVT